MMKRRAEIAEALLGMYVMADRARAEVQAASGLSSWEEVARLEAKAEALLWVLGAPSDRSSDETVKA